MLLATSGTLGVVILLTDQILRGAADHFYALLLFVIVDFALAGSVIAKPSIHIFRLSAIWCALRIILQVADISQAPIYQFTYAQFADYLFNPISSVSSSLGNPLGVPGALLDLIIIIELAILTFVVMPPGRIAEPRQGAALSHREAIVSEQQGNVNNA